MEMSTFNVKDGYTEALVRGMKQGLLTPEEYRRLTLADSLEDMRSALEDTEYGSFLQDEPSPIAVTTLGIRCREKMTQEFRHLKAQAAQPLVQFLDFICIEKMIDNVVGLIQGSINKKRADELLSRVDPLGWFPQMKAIVTMDLTAGYEELYRTILVDTPLGKYFEMFLSLQSEMEDPANRNLQEMGNMLSEADLEMMRNVLKRAWLEDFYSFCERLGGSTANEMCHILKLEADFRVLSVTVNAIAQPNATADRSDLYPSFGYLYPEGTDRIRKAFNDATVRAALDCYPKYLNLYEQCKDFYLRDDMRNGADDDAESSVKPLEDLLYAEQVAMCELTFDQQFSYSVFYAWVKLKEQEIRNVLWIGDMILMNRKDQTDAILPMFVPKV